MALAHQTEQSGVDMILTEGVIDFNLELPCDNENDLLSSGRAELRRALCSRTLVAIAELHKLYKEQPENFLENDTSGNAFSEVIKFAKAVISGLYATTGEDDIYTDCLASIFDSVFLSSLLDLRRRILGPASSDLETLDDEQDCGGIFTLIDVLLSLLGDVVVAVAGGWSTPNCTQNVLPMSLQTQKQEGNVRTASQLPPSFLELPDVLRSQRSSPALKRLCLSLLFATTVMRSDLVGCDPWSETQLDPSHLLMCLECLIGDYALQAQTMTTMNACDINPTDDTQRGSFSMLLALYSAADMASQDRSPSPFRPHTEAQLLELTRAILAINELKKHLVIPKLDNCQAILLKWGCFTPWAWSSWDDARVLSFDIVKVLTATWLCHVEEVFAVPSQERHTNTPDDLCTLCPRTQAILRAAVSINPAASFTALFHQLEHASDQPIDVSTTRESEPEPEVHDSEQTKYEYIRLYRATWSLAFLLSNHASELPLANRRLIAERLLGLFGSLGSGVSENKVKAEVVRCLTFLEKKAAIGKVCSDNDFSGKDGRNLFTGRIAKSINQALRTGTLLDSDEKSSLSLTVLLDMVAILCKSGATGCLPASVPPLLAKLVKELSSPSSQSHLDLRISLLNCLAAVKASGCTSNKSPQSTGSTSLTLHKSCSDETIFHLALSMHGTNLRLAAALASYVIASVKKSTDPLLVAEAWDYFSDALMFTAANQCTTQDAVSDISAAIEQICEGLAVLLGRTDAKISGFLLSSPLTLSFVHTLKRLLPSANAQQSKAYERLFEKMQILTSRRS